MKEKRSEEEEALAQDTPPERLAVLAEKSLLLSSLVAKNSAAPGELLRKLAKDDHPDVLRSLAENPSTPLDVLFELWQSFPEQFVKNPLVSLLWLEGLGFLSEMPLDTFFSLSRTPSLPRIFWEAVLGHPDSDVREVIATSPYAPSDILGQLARDPEEGVRHTVAHHPNLPPDALEFLAQGENLRLRGNVAENLSTPDHVLKALSLDPEDYVRKRAAETLARKQAKVTQSS